MDFDLEAGAVHVRHGTASKHCGTSLFREGARPSSASRSWLTLSFTGRGVAVLRGPGRVVVWALRKLAGVGLGAKVQRANRGPTA